MQWHTYTGHKYGHYDGHSVGRGGIIVALCCLIKSRKLFNLEFPWILNLLFSGFSVGDCGAYAPVTRNHFCDGDLRKPLERTPSIHLTQSNLNESSVELGKYL